MYAGCTQSPGSPCHRRLCAPTGQDVHRLQRLPQRHAGCAHYDPTTAAHITTRQRQRTKISDPWLYTIGVYNGTLARLSYLYALTHWVENGLRSQVDLYYLRTRGTTWHRYPDQYLPVNSVAEFLELHKPMGLTYNIVRGGRAEITQPDTPGQFLQAVTFGFLLSMVRILHYNTKGSGILVQPSGQPTSRQQITALLEGAKDARNAVAHNHALDSGRFSRYNNQLLMLLTTLHFDVAKAMRRSESVRATFIAKQLREAEEKR